MSPEEDTKKLHEKIFEKLTVKNFPKMGKELALQIQETQKKPKQDKSKVKHTKKHIKHIKQTNKDHTQRAKLKSSKGKATNNTQGDPHKDNS